MRLTFLGTKGYIEEHSRKHYYHSSLLIEYKKFRLLIDHGTNSKPLSMIKADAILISHGHPDTFKWVVKDENYDGPIYTTKETKELSKFKKKFRILKPNKWFSLGPFKIMAYPVVHSFRAPAAGFKIKADKTILYNSDLVVMKDKRVLKDVDLYIGDGSSVRGNLVRKRGKQLFGHARMQTQINWCRQYGIKDIIFTHVGKEVIEKGDKKVLRLIKQDGFSLSLSYDGMAGDV